MLRQRLQAEGWEIWTAESVAEGQALLERWPIDLLILDGQLPDGPGDGLFEQAQAHPDHPAVIWVSADNPPAASLELGDSCHVLPKPFDVRDLVRLASRRPPCRTGAHGPTNQLGLARRPAH
jgi:DNA-binding response OmpR family regulator